MSHKLTVGDLKKAIAGYSDETLVTFGGSLTFYRIKFNDSEGIPGEVDSIFIEWDQAEGYLSPKFKDRNPAVQVVFLKSPDLNDAPVSTMSVGVF